MSKITLISNIASKFRKDLDIVVKGQREMIWDAEEIRSTYDSISSLDVGCKRLRMLFYSK